ncbi:interferon alpha/beta receptor 2-like isoform X2 [Denticeps clupeoides]|uniref:interferon alpha/beta receptor 2-like isoform X2 n=1 Tax=Denticeps clupeoides TaxID=299321 RepID=UPI0010A3EB00|nr:interferon alpha/beta receptor 2 isoform X2 [Denticeps clupeoides]XP_028851394.1 interferon alpha/beta receptor 2 isoform X2 [Denticeps clupeoides]
MSKVPCMNVPHRHRLVRIPATHLRLSSWHLAEGCERVLNPLQCNLTSAFWPLDDTFYPRVTAWLGGNNSQSEMHKGFRPIDDTTPEPPKFSLALCNQALCTILTSPSDQLQSAYKSYRYRLNITTERETKFFYKDTDLKNVSVTAIPGRQYCVSISIIEKNVTSAAKCINFAAEQNKESFTAVLQVMLLLLLLGCVAVVALLVQSGFICLNTSLPSVLADFTIWEPLRILLPIESPVLSSITGIKALYQHGKADRESEDEEGGEGKERSQEREDGYESVKLAGPAEESNSSSSSYSPPCITASHHCPILGKDEQEMSSWVLNAPQWTLPPLEMERDTQTFDMPLHFADMVEQGDGWKEEEDREVNVNLLSVTLGLRPNDEPGRYYDEKEAEGKESKIPLPHSQTPAIRPSTAMLIRSYSEEEESDGVSGYMSRD